MAATKGQVENRQCINDIKPLLCSKDMNKSLEKQDFCCLFVNEEIANRIRVYGTYSWIFSLPPRDS